MDKFIVEGGRTLRGTVRAKGSKNAALPMMAASILLDPGDRLVLRGVPQLSDIKTMSLLLGKLGVRADRAGETVTLRAVDDSEVEAPYEIVRQMRASICVLGPLVGRRRAARVSQPGGCVIGVRPVDLHTRGIAQLGAAISQEHGYIVAQARRLVGRTVYLGGAFGSTVTGTENVLMAAVLAQGTSLIECAACEPEVQAVAELLNAMGARIQGIGSPRLIVHGVRRLHGADVEVIPDRIEAGTFMAAAAVTGGDVRIDHSRPDHMVAVVEHFRSAGVHVETGDDWIRVMSNGLFKPVDVATLPYPGFPTDMQAQFMALMTLGEGITVITEKIYPDRFMHVAELGRMGARIRKEGSCAIIEGVKSLHGAEVMASDLRASASLVVAALAADGVSEVHRVYHLDRGYDHLERRLNALGARVQRVEEKKGALVREAV
ncbi:MAG: UDP-N-acetylglucosamine 1-carboxyvinyltransferase [Planctomycetes bacterium]|nr:UDP-N-acetylglucosamine 1-carboxyvinyltransferase [Planctomycetota bacterium]